MLAFHCELCKLFFRREPLPHEQNLGDKCMYLDSFSDLCEDLETFMLLKGESFSVSNCYIKLLQNKMKLIIGKF